MFLLPQLLSQGITDVLMLLAEVTQAWEATANAEATRIVAMLAAEISAQEDAAAWYNAALHVKDVEDRAT
jgi:hypothetical protein